MMESIWQLRAGAYVVDIEINDNIEILLWDFNSNHCNEYGNEYVVFL